MILFEQQHLQVIQFSGRIQLFEHIRHLPEPVVLDLNDVMLPIVTERIGMVCIVTPRLDGLDFGECLLTVVGIPARELVAVNLQRVRIEYLKCGTEIDLTDQIIHFFDVNVMGEYDQSVFDVFGGSERLDELFQVADARMYLY